MKTKQFTKDNLEAIRKRIQEQLDAVAAELGLSSLKLEKITYSNEHFNARIEGLAWKSEADIEAQHLTQSKYLGFDYNIVGTKISDGTNIYTITGFELRTVKPIICEREVKGQKVSYRVNSQFYRACKRVG